MASKGGRKPTKQASTRSVSKKQAKAKPIAAPSKLSKADKPEQYEKIPGDKARRYRKVGGRKVISRRQHDALLARAHVEKQAAPASFSKERTQQYWKFVKAWQRGTKSPLDAREVSRSKEFKEKYAGFRSKDNSPTGAKARFLVELGWRDPQATYAVGESPRRKGARGGKGRAGLRSMGRKAA